MIALAVITVAGLGTLQLLDVLSRSNSNVAGQSEAMTLARKLLDERAPQPAARVMIETLAGLPLPKYRDLARDVVNALAVDDPLREELRALVRRGPRPTPPESCPTPMSKR